MSTINDTTTTPEFTGFPPEIIQAVFQMIVLLGSPEEDIVEHIAQILPAFAQDFYRGMLATGYTEDDSAFAMLELGFAIGLEAGHIEGHNCAAAATVDSDPDYCPPGYL